MLSRIWWRIAAAHGILLSVLLIVLGVFLTRAEPPATWIVVGAIILSGLVLSSAFAYALTRGHVVLINEMIQACRAFGSHNEIKDIPAHSRSEAGRLAAAFNEMLKALRGQVEEIKHEQMRLSTVLNSMSDGIVIIDGEGRVTTVNPAAERLLGVSRVRSLGHSLIEVTRDHELDAIARSCFQPGARIPVTALIEHAAHGRQIRAVASPIFDDHSGQALILLQDVTELRRAEIIRREFVANVSHEIRTPIASLKALVETLEDGALQDPPAARDFLSRMHVEVDGLAQMVEELLELSRIESGRVALKKEPSHLGHLVSQSAYRLRQQAERQGLSLEVITEDPDPLVLADPDRMGQAVINLVHNAIKFTNPGGWVEVRVRRRDDSAIVEVEDNGIGIAQQDLTRLFERFYKADKARSGRGTGLGLAIAKHLVQAHGGQISAESPGPGQGSTFTVKLPLAPTSEIVPPVAGAGPNI